MNKDDKKILIVILQLCLFGAFCKVGFDVHTYLSIEETIDDLKFVLLLILAVAILLIFIGVCLFAVNKQKRIDKARRKNNNRINMLENQMMSTSNNANNVRRNTNNNGRTTNQRVNNQRR